MEIENRSTIYEALESAVNSFKKLPFDLDSKKFIIVPDKITLTTERMLSDALGGIMDINIVTFASLVRKYVLPQSELLSRQGSIMLIKRIVEEKHSELKCYKKSALTKGFAEKIYETINDLASAEISPGEVKLKNGNTKAEDIALIYSEYNKRVESFMPDTAYRMRLLKKYVSESTLFDDAYVVFACFDDMNRQMISVKDEIAKKAKQVSIYKAHRNIKQLGKITLFESDSQVTTAKDIASKITYLIKVKNIDPNKICVLTSDDNPYELRRIFKENDIPFSAAAPLKLSHHPLGTFISLALRVPIRGFKPREVINLSKSAYLGFKEKQAENFERYTEKFGINYKGFFDKFEKQSIFTEQAERVRCKIVGILEKYKEDIPSRLKMLIDIARTSATKELIEENDGRANPIERLTEIYELARKILNGASPKIAADAIIDAMESMELSSRPKCRDAIDIGTEEELKAKCYEYVFVSDFSSNNHPKTVRDDGLLNDEDIEELNMRSGDVLNTSLEINRRNKDTFYYILNPAKEIYLYYMQTPCRIYHELKCGPSDTIAKFSLLARKNYNDADTLLKECPTKNMLLERYLIDKQESQKSAASKYIDFAHSVIGKDIPIINEVENEISGIGDIMINDHVSPSVIEKYCLCPRQHFYQHALNAKKVEKAEIDNISIGNIIHRVAELFVKDMQNPDDIVKGLLDQAIEESEKVIKEYDYNILFEEALEVCKEILRQSTIGLFKPYGSEMGFGISDDDKLEPITINVEGNDIKIIGKIDRVDKAVLDDGTEIYRVFDYKTGKPNISDELIKKGQKLQLPLYLAVIKKLGTPVAAFYFPTQKENGEYKLKALLEISQKNIDAMNKNGELIHIKQKKDGTFSDKCAGNVLAMGAKFERIIDYAIKLTTNSAKEIFNGFIKASPAKKEVCRYCDYRTCCEYNGNGRVKEIQDEQH